MALNCGMMLRECLRHEPLARIVLFSEDFYCFFRYVELSTFDIASDAFASFKVHWRICSPVCRDFILTPKLTSLLFVSGSPHKTQNNVCRFSGEQLRQGERSAVCFVRELAEFSRCANTRYKCPSGVHGIREAAPF